MIGMAAFRRHVSRRDLGGAHYPVLLWYGISFCVPQVTARVPAVRAG